MKIGCLTVTEDRAPIWGISLASYLTQSHPDTLLYVFAHPIGDYVNGALVRLTDATPTGNLASVLVSASATTPKRVQVNTRFESERGVNVVCRVLDECVRLLFDRGCDLVAIFDDDDWSPPDRLAGAAREAAALARHVGALDKVPLVVSYSRGHMVNLRSFEGVELKLPHLWGSTLTFNKQAWLLADGFAPGPWPGQDKAFLTRAERRGAKLVALPGAPINFCHNKNVASFAVGAGLMPLRERIAALPPMVRREVEAAQAFLIERNVWPPGTGDSA